jgi:hypothetical protein
MALDPLQNKFFVGADLPKENIGTEGYNLRSGDGFPGYGWFLAQVTGMDQGNLPVFQDHKSYMELLSKNVQSVFQVLANGIAQVLGRLKGKLQVIRLLVEGLDFQTRPLLGQFEAVQVEPSMDQYGRNKVTTGNAAFLGSFRIATERPGCAVPVGN